MKRSGELKRSPMKRATRRLPARSQKMAEKYAMAGGRRELVAQMLSVRVRCEARWECRGARTVDVHERLSRARGGDILDPVQAHMIAVCRACHDRIGREPKAAEDRRLLLPSWHKCPAVGPC